MARNSSPQQLAAENEDLRARLERAEESVREILSGESDALFVPGADGAQLFTLKGADQSYRTLIENMSEGALTLTPEGLILYANQRFAQMLGTPLERVIGSEIYSWIAPESRQVLQTLLQKEAVANRSEELILAAADGTQVPVYLSVSRLLLDNMPDSFCMVATDLTEQKRNEAILAAEELARAILEQAADAIVICDRTGRIIRASKQAQAFCGKSPLGRPFEHAFPLCQLNGTEFSPIGAIDTTHRQSVEARLEHGGRGFALLVSVGHLTDARNEMLGSVVTLTDITERKRAEEVIRTSEQRLNLALESSQLGVWDLDLIHDTSWRSLHHDRIFGYESRIPDWGLAKALSHMVPEDRDRVSQCFEEAKRTGRLGFECQIIQPDQRRHSILVQGLVYRDDNSRPIRMMGTVLDITEHKRAKEALQRSELRYRSLFENMLEGCAYCRALFEQDQLRDFVYLETNRAFEDLTGLKDVVGKNVSDVIPGSLKTDRELFDLYGRVALTGKSEKRETYFDALGIWISVSVYSPEREYFVAVFDNITTRKLAEKALSKSEEEFRTLAESMPQIVWITRADGWTIYINQQWMDYTGLTLEESLGHGWNKPFHPDDQKAAWDAWQKATATGGICSIESRLRRADATYRWWLFRGVPLKDVAGNIVKWFGTCTDIDDMKVAELNILDANRTLRENEVSIKRLNRVYTILSGIDTLIVRARDRDDLFREACQIAVEKGQFRIAWIGVIDRSAGTTVLVASAGVDEELLTAIKDRNSHSMSEDPLLGDNMAARAMREKKAVVVNDLRNSLEVPFGKKYADSGIFSIATLPLIVSDEAIGVIALYASENEFFHEEELKLLKELAGDIAFAIDHIDKRDRLSYIAYYDELTGLANRSLFIERVAQYVRSVVGGRSNLAVGVLDLERFKNINHSLGRPAGDALLKQVADWLTHYLGDANLLARVDADHFAFVLPDIKHERDVPRLIEKALEDFTKHPFMLDQAVFRVAAKVGVAIFPDDGPSADILFRNAEIALRKAKVSGDRYTLFAQKMSETAVLKPTLESQLRDAIDNEEFVLHYQPKVNLVSGKLTGAEALIRWNDPRRGLVPPAQFIPILEETGLIFEVGRWALHKAVKEYRRWRAAGLPAVRIAVNVSPLQVRNIGFVAEIKEAIGVDAHAGAGLELEITETTIMKDLEYTIATLQEIRELGIVIAIDDFGTGFSSLNYLAKLPLDTLKIDRSFVVDMTSGPRGLALVSTIISLGQALNLKLVAEGVETEEQSRLLRLLRCDEMQGYLYGRPVPIEAFEAAFLVPRGQHTSS
jgi:diguanylate cyclase (GGDEF)-like protein/PAS domain S-box-containing protein